MLHRFLNRFSFLSAGALLLCAAGGFAPSPAWAQDEEEFGPELAPRFPEIKDSLSRERLEQLANQLNTNSRPKMRFNSQPWLGPTGDQLVAIVGGKRMLTKPQFDRRVERMLRMLPTFDQAGITGIQREGAMSDAQRLAEDRRIMLEGQLLGEWIETAALSLHAEELGMTVSNEEIDKAIAELAQHNSSGTAGGQSASNVILLDFPESELRQEVRDALMVEKVVHARIEEYFSEEQMREIYRKGWAQFLMPPRAQTWQLFYPIVGVPTAKQLDAIEDELNRLRRRLSRADTPEEYAALQEELTGRKELIERELTIGQADPQARAALSRDPRNNIVLNDLGWVSGGDMVPMDVQVEIFKLKPGQTSKIIRSDQGLHVVKVIARQEGQRTFAEARPQIEAVLFEKVRETMYGRVKQNMKIFSDSSGLKQWTEIAQADEMATMAPASTITTQEPDLSGLRRDLRDRAELNRPDLMPPPVEELLRENAEKREASGAQ